ncbi:MAG: hypothetical protein ACLP9L_30000 [Thermoguttaceae bacterium]
MAIAEQKVAAAGYLSLSPTLLAALRLLLRAETTAQLAECPAWDFAVEIEALIGLGLTNSDLRLLVRCGYVEHAVEISCPNDTARRFRPWDNLCFHKRTCFVLTASGAQLAASEEGPMPVLVPVAAFLLPHSPVQEAVEILARGKAAGRSACSGAAEQSAIPAWDGARKVLWLGGQLVKQFKVPSRNQEAILAAFEEESWPPAIDDPLPPEPELEEKRRLRATIQSLNAHHKKHLLHFRGDGSGQRVLWEAVARRARRSAVPGRQIRTV